MPLPSQRPLDAPCKRHVTVHCAAAAALKAHAVLYYTTMTPASKLPLTIARPPLTLNPLQDLGACTRQAAGPYSNNMARLAISNDHNPVNPMQYAAALGCAPQEQVHHSQGYKRTCLAKKARRTLGLTRRHIKAGDGSDCKQLTPSSAGAVSCGMFSLF